jgi:hypothetical protein
MLTLTTITSPVSISFILNSHEKMLAQIVPSPGREWKKKEKCTGEGTGTSVNHQKPDNDLTMAA